MVPSTQVRSARDGGHAAQAYNGAVRRQLGDLQRARIIAAMFDVAAQQGPGSVTVGHVVECSGVSRRTFYEHFDDREDCLLAAFERALTLASQRVLPAYRAEKGWRAQIRAGLVELLSLFDEEPGIGRMLVCESQVSGPRIAQRRAEILAQLTQIVEEGRGESKRKDTLSPLAAEGTTGGVLSVIQTRLLEGKSGPLLALTNELTSMIVLPYFGSAAARRELERPMTFQASPRRDGTLLTDPFKGAGIRLTYRTVRVLTTISQHPQASNRQIGESAGITDQGQISKLLSRLERIGLLTNTRIYPGQGAPNSWALTEKGKRIAQNILTHTKGEMHAGRER